MIDRVNNTVSLARNIIGLVNDVKDMLPNFDRKKAKYLAILDEKVATQNENFCKLSNDYFDVVTRARASVQSAKSRKNLYIVYQTLKEDRDAIALPRSELLGSSSGVNRLLDLYAPVDLKSIISDYKDYVMSIEMFFYGVRWPREGAHFFRIFGEAYRSFRWNLRLEDVSDKDDINILEESRATVTSYIDETLQSMEDARRDVADKFELLKGRIAAIS